MVLRQASRCACPRASFWACAIVVTGAAVPAFRALSAPALAQDLPLLPVETLTLLYGLKVIEARRWFSDRPVQRAGSRALARIRCGTSGRSWIGRLSNNYKDVVRNERRLSVEIPPYGIADEAVYQALYPKGHPYHGYVTGSHADI